MDELLLTPIYQHWPSCSDVVEGLLDDFVPCPDGFGSDEDLDRLPLCHEASGKMLHALKLQEGDLSLPFITDQCWIRWTGNTRRPKTELHLPFIFLDRSQSAVTAKLIFQEIRNEACSGSLYPAREMQGVQTDAEWDGAIEAALYHAEQNGFPIPPTSDLRWQVVLDQAPLANEKSPIRAKSITGRSAGVTFLLALYHHFGKVAEWNTRQAFESIISLAALPTCDQAEQALIHLGGDESKKALALQGLGLASGSQHLHVVLAGSFAGFQNIELPPSVKISHAETVEQLKSAIQEIIRRERMSALEKPQALIFEDYLKLKRKGFVGREWLFEEIDLWRFESEERALLITGDPGSGKTSLVAELIHRNPGGQVIGYHCCQSNEIGTLRPGRFVQSLAAMIASCLPCYAELIDGEKLKRALGDERCEKDPGGALLEGILHPLQNIPIPDGGIRYILVDALDESIGMNGQRTIPDILASHIQRFPSWLRLVATTRNEPRVMQSLSGLRAKQIDATDDRNLRDLTTYLYQRLSEPSLAERLAASRTTAATAVQHISRKSCGNFLYAVQVLDGIARDDYSLANLDVLPRGLDGIYLDFFHRIYGHENTQAGEATYQRARPLLQILCTALEPLTRAELASASQLDSEEELPQMLRKLAQLLSRQIRATGEETLSFHHKSVPDWLTTHLDTNAFAVGPTKGRKRLAEFCSESLASSRAKPSWYVRRHAVEHFLEVADWDSAVEALCDLEFIEARAISQELPAMLVDYTQAASLLPEGEKERQLEASRQAELDRYATEMAAYAAAWSRIRHGSGEDEPRLPTPVEAAHLRTKDEIASERKRITKTPSRLDQVRAFRVFVATNSTPLQNYATQEGFAANLALNDAPAGPVHQKGKQKLATFDCIKLIKRFAAEEDYTPAPACWAILEGHTAAVNSIALSANGCRAASGSYDRTICVWDLESGECIKVLEGHNAAVISVALSADGNRAVSGSSDKTLRVWDLESGECIKVLEGHTHWVSSVALSADGRRAVSGSYDEAVRVWDLESGECIKVLEGHSVSSIALSADGCRAVSGGHDKTLRVWDLDSGKCLKVLDGHKNDIHSVALSADGHRAVSGGLDRFVRVWDLNSGECLQILRGHSDSIDSVAMSADGSRIVSGSDDETLRVWDLDCGARLRYVVKIFSMFWGQRLFAKPIALTADGLRVISVGEDDTLTLWNLDCEEYIRRLNFNKKRPPRFDAAGNMAVLSYYDQTIRVWDLESGVCLKNFEGPTHRVMSIALSADGRRAVSGSYDKTVRVWDLESGECIKVLEGHTHLMTSIALTADGRRAVSGSSDNTLRVWDLKSGECIKVFEGHTRTIDSIVLSADGRRAVSGSFDKTVRVWDLESGECIKVFEWHSVKSFALSADGRRAVSGSSDKILRVWDLDSGKCIKIFDGHKKEINSIVLSADGRFAVSSSFDNTLRIWNLESGDCCARFFRRGFLNCIFFPTPRNMAFLAQNGRIEFFDLENLHMGPLITTAQRALISEDLPAGPVTARPPCCGQLISIPLDLAERIEHWHLASDERSDNAYADPALLFKCSSCETPLRMNPFFLDVKPITA